MSEPRPLRWPWTIYAVTMVVLGAAVTLTIVNDTFAAFVVIAIIMMLGYGTIGAFLATRFRQNPIGWLMLAIAAAFAVAGLTDEYVTYALVTHPGGLPAPSIAAWINGISSIFILAPVLIILLLFPTGHPLSPRWRIVVITLMADAAVLLLAGVLTAGPIDSDHATVDNPTGIPSLRPEIDVVNIVAGVVLAAIVIAAFVSLVLRYRRAEEHERQQLRWFAYVAAAALVFLVIAIVGQSSSVAGDVGFYGFFVTVGLGIPIAIGYAIVRYRLYDIDLVVKKGVTFSLVALSLTGLYLAFVAVATVGNLSRLVFGIVLVAFTFRPVLRAARSMADRLVYGRRATPYEVLSEFSERMSETYSTDDVLPRMANVLQGATGADRSDVWLLVGSALRPRASWPNDAPAPAIVAVPDGELPRLPGSFAADVRHQGELLGALTVTMPANDPLDAARERLVRDLAAQAGPMLSNVRLIDELRASRTRMVAAQDEGRRRLERNIHDGAQQQLVALAVKTRLADSMIDRDTGKAHEMLTQIQLDTNDALETLRDLARGIYPPLLADKGLAVALQAQGRKAQLPVTIDADGVGRYPVDAEATVYFCVLEALNNTTKYAGASAAAITLRASGDALTFEVSDDGVGFDPDRGTTQGTGIQGMRDRVDAVGGSLRVRSAPGEGTLVSGSVPITN
jgi:signal transduction histidine kinase